MVHPVHLYVLEGFSSPPDDKVSKLLPVVEGGFEERGKDGLDDLGAAYIHMLGRLDDVVDLPQNLSSSDTPTLALAVISAPGAPINKKLSTKTNISNHLRMY